MDNIENNVYITIPCDESLENIYNSNVIIDMANLNFDSLNINEKVQMAFLYIRNAGLSDSKFDFSNVDFNEKIVFLKEYLYTKFDIIIPSLIKTWIEILYKENHIELDDTYGILDTYELESSLLILNKEIEELSQFIISIPLASIHYINKITKISMDFSQIESTDFNKFYIPNIYQMFHPTLMMPLINNIKNIKPLFYNNYFNENNPFINIFLNDYPYLNILKIFSSDDNCKDKFINNINNLLEVNKEVNNATTD